MVADGGGVSDVADGVSVDCEVVDDARLEVRVDAVEPAERHDLAMHDLLASEARLVELGKGAEQALKVKSQPAVADGMVKPPFLLLYLFP